MIRLVSLMTLLAWTANAADVMHFSQRLDHDNPQSVATFPQRYSVNREFARGERPPVILQICGEWTCNEMDPAQHPKSLIDYAQALGAVIVTVEHRFYGESHPSDRLDLPSLKFLSTDYALKDLLAVQEHLAKAENLQGKWVAAGCSYAGVLAAYLRGVAPDRIAGALASSAPVRAEETMPHAEAWSWDEFPKECRPRIKEVQKTVEGLGRPQDPLPLFVRALFKTQGSAINYDLAFATGVWLTGATMHGKTHELCRMLASESNPLVALARYSELNGEPLEKNSISTMLDPVTSMMNGSGAWRAWTWQTCTEYGFSTADMRECEFGHLPWVDSDFCKDVFGIALKAQVVDLNEKYYKPLLDRKKTSQVIFTNGTRDFYAGNSILPKTNPNPKHDTLMFDKAGHCPEWHGYPEGKSTWGSLGGKSSPKQRVIERLKEFVK